MHASNKNVYPCVHKRNQNGILQTGQDRLLNNQFIGQIRNVYSNTVLVSSQVQKALCKRCFQGLQYHNLFLKTSIFIIVPMNQRNTLVGLTTRNLNSTVSKAWYILMGF